MLQPRSTAPSCGLLPACTDLIQVYPNPLGTSLVDLPTLAKLQAALLLADPVSAALRQLHARGRRRSGPHEC